MGDTPLFETGAIFVAVLTLALVRLGWGRGGWHWAAGWSCLWAAGFASSLAESSALAAHLYPVLGTAFAALLFSGACVFSGHRVPAWLVPLAAVVAVTRAVLVTVVDVATTQAMASTVITLAALAGAWEVLHPQRRGDRSWDRVLAVSLPFAAVASWAYTYFATTAPGGWQGPFVWLMVGVLVGGVQVVSLLGRVAQQSEEQRARLAAVVDAVPVGLALLRSDGLLAMSNPTFEKIVSNGGPIGRGARLEVVLDALRGQLEEGEAARLEASMRGSDGLSLELHLRNGLRVLSSTWPITEPRRNEPLGRLWLLADLTEERQLQERLERARRLETLGGFAGGVAHDFNNQLTSVLGNTALLRDTLGGHPEALEVLEDLESSAEYCASLTQDVLDFARRRLPRPAPLDLSGHLPEILGRCTVHAQATRIALASELPPILADPRSLERVVTNLLENAWAAAGPGGSVTLEARRSSPDRVDIEVVDDGPGIEASVRAHIFDPFFTTKAVGEGTGLGLAIVYGIVSAQGGEVRVESGAEGGTRMITSWPVADAGSGKD